MSQELFTLIIGLIVLIILGGTGYVIVKGVKTGNDMGNSLVKGFTQQHGFTLLVITILSVIGETLTISSYEPETSSMEGMNFISRVMAHVVVALFSWILLTQFPVKLLEALEVIPFTFKKDKFKEHFEILKKANVTKVQAFLIFISPFLYLVVGFMLPFMNLYLLAIGLGNDIQLELFVHQYLNPFKGMPIEDYYQTIPISALKHTMIDTVGVEFLPRDYSPFKDMSFELIMMLGTVLVASIGAIFKGLHFITTTNLSNSLLDIGKKKVNEDKQKTKEKEEVKKLKQIMNSVLIKFGLVDTKWTDKRNEIIDEALEILEQADTTNKNKLTNTLARLDTVDLSTSDLSVFKQDVRSLWQGSKKDYKGFGRPLPNIQ